MLPGRSGLLHPVALGHRYQDGSLSASPRAVDLPNLDSGGTQWAVWGVHAEKPTGPVRRRAVCRTRVSPGHKRLGEQRAPSPFDLDWKILALETRGRAPPALPVKGPRAPIFGFAGHVVSVTATQLCGCGIKVTKFNV